MVEIKLQHIFTMTDLLRRGAQYNFIELTTSNLGKNIKKSQQAASRHLLDLENAGYIERLRKGQKFRIKITNRGYSEIQSLFSTLKSAIEVTPFIIDFEGTVVSGMGEGAYYMALEGYRKQFKEKLGFEPYPGTLNVKLVDQVFMNARRDIGKYPSVFIDGFSDDTRTYGWVKCYKAEINKAAVNNAAVLVLERTHYDDSMLELIAPVSLKESIGIHNGDKISVKVHISDNLERKY
ncbi:MAG: CTP-dependent riboflavin kinase [Nitrososphaeraceae archaeon]|nr:CTP-dependent riboflavin kinase [Nitrososphaeraceae archaeon]